jgi:hypothetical protein
MLTQYIALSMREVRGKEEEYVMVVVIDMMMMN